MAYYEIAITCSEGHRQTGWAAKMKKSIADNVALMIQRDSVCLHVVGDDVECGAPVRTDVVLSKRPPSEST